MGKGGKESEIDLASRLADPLLAPLTLSLGSISRLFIFFSNSSFKSTLQRCEVKHMPA